MELEMRNLLHNYHCYYGLSDHKTQSKSQLIDIVKISVKKLTKKRHRCKKSIGVVQYNNKATIGLDQATQSIQKMLSEMKSCTECFLNSKTKDESDWFLEACKVSFLLYHLNVEIIPKTRIIYTAYVFLMKFIFVYKKAFLYQKSIWSVNKIYSPLTNSALRKRKQME